MKLRLSMLLLAAVAVLGFCLFAGPHAINPFAISAMERDILLQVRLPRVVAGLLVGMALGASGAVLQGVLRNPLADPYILGLSSGASLTAAGGLMLGVNLPATPLMAFAGASLTGAMVGILSIRRGGMLPERMLLAGIGLGFLLSAVLMVMMSLSSNEGLRRAVLWMFGDLANAEWSLIPYGFIFILAGLLLASARGKALNSLMLGDDLSHSLGFSPHRERLILFIAVCLMTSASVSLGGMIGFIGLLMPHIMRFFVGADNRVLVPSSALAGGVVLMLSDLAGRSVMAPAELPSGIITTLVGAPYFLYLLRRRDILHE